MVSWKNNILLLKGVRGQLLDLHLPIIKDQNGASKL